MNIIINLIEYLLLFYLKFHFYLLNGSLVIRLNKVLDRVLDGFISAKIDNY